MKVGPKLARSALALHRTNHAVTYDESSNVCSARLLDKFLNQYVDLGPSKSLECAFCRGHGLAKYNSQALSPFHQLDDDGWATDHTDQLLCSSRRVCETGNRQTNPQARHDLQRPEFVTGATYGH